MVMKREKLPHIENTEMLTQTRTLTIIIEYQVGDGQLVQQLFLSLSA